MLHQATGCDFLKLKSPCRIEFFSPDYLTVMRGEAAGLGICFLANYGLAWSTTTESVSALYLIVRFIFLSS